MYLAFNNQHAVVMFCIPIQDQLNEPGFVADCHMRNLAVYTKPIPLPNINALIVLVGAYAI